MLNLLAVFWERIVCLFVGTVDDFEGTLFGPVRLVIANGDAVLLFEMIF